MTLGVIHLTFGDINLTKRNRLTTLRAAKIAYLAHNWKLKNKDPTKKPQTNVDNTMANSSSSSTIEKP